MTRKAARDLLFKLLYQSEFQNEKASSLYDIAESENKIDEKSKEYILSALDGIEGNFESINKIISEKSDGWKLNRISKISISCLRLGIFEILFNPEIPDTVAINEAVGIAKLYEGEEAASFVNGILSSVIKDK